MVEEQTEAEQEEQSRPNCDQGLVQQLGFTVRSHRSESTLADAAEKGPNPFKRSQVRKQLQQKDAGAAEHQARKVVQKAESRFRKVP